MRFSKPEQIIIGFYNKASLNDRILLVSRQAHFGYYDLQFCSHNQNNLSIEHMERKIVKTNLRWIEISVAK